MANFDSLALIPAQHIYSAARVSAGKGAAVLKRLELQRKVTPERTPTGRTLLSPVDGRRVYDALTA